MVELAGEPGIDSRLQEEKEPLPLLRALFPAHALRVTGSKLTAGSLLLLPFLVVISIVQCSRPRIRPKKRPGLEEGGVAEIPVPGTAPAIVQPIREILFLLPFRAAAAAPSAVGSSRRRLSIPERTPASLNPRNLLIS